jgi:plasmid stability protein
MDDRLFASKALALCYHKRMATLHVRNVPPKLYEALRARAAREGRSISAETIDILWRAFPVVPPDTKAFMAELREFKKQNPWLGPPPEELIRRDRDAR